MIKIVMVAVRDQKADSFGNPWFAQNVAMALRHFADAVNTDDPSNAWRKHPEDYALWHLGYYFPATGTFELLPTAVQLIVASDVKE